MGGGGALQAPPLLIPSPNPGGISRSLPRHARTRPRSPAAAATVASPFAAEAFLQVLRLRQGVPFVPGARRAQVQPPAAHRSRRRASLLLVWRQRAGVVVGWQGSPVLRLPQEFRDGAGAGRAQAVPLLGGVVELGCHRERF